MKIEDTEILDWRHVTHGIRGPIDSWEKNDSEWVFYDTSPHSLDIPTLISKYQVGPDDLNLMTRLRGAGTNHRRFMWMVTVYVDLIGPLYWWREFNTYKVGTMTNSCPTIHEIATEKLILEGFSCEHLFDSADGENTDCWTYSTEGIREIEPIDILNLTIAMLNKARELYLDYQQRASTND